MLHFKNFSKSYGKFLALSIDDITVEKSIYWVKGANGSGKSTLLKTIAGIISFEGDIILHPDISIKKQTIPYRKRVNYAEAEPVYPAFLTGMEMIKMFSSAKLAPTGQENYYVESMHMEDYMKEPLGTYSSGMLKKLSLVLAFLGRPDLILLDEPLITIDQESLNVVYQWIAEKNTKDGTGFLLASHQTFEHKVLPAAKVLQVENRTIKIIS